MKSIEILRRDHTLMKRVLDLSEKAMKMLKDGQPLPEGLPEKLSDFLVSFIIRCHMGKEEEIVFDEMEAAGVFTDELTIESVRKDHCIIRSYIEKIAATVSGEKDGDLIEYLDGMVTNMQAHSKREDRVFYPMGNRLISPEADERILRHYETMDSACHNYFEVYTKIVEGMEAQMGIEIENP
jgi:hemerythrin-like domain-containing protein